MIYIIQKQIIEIKVEDEKKTLDWNSKKAIKLPFLNWLLKCVSADRFFIFQSLTHIRTSTSLHSVAKGNNKVFFKANTFIERQIDKWEKHD